MTHRSNIALWTTVIGVATANAAPALAQAADPTLAPTLTAVEKDKLVVKRAENLRNPSTTSTGGQLQSDARLVTSTDDTSAQLTFSTHGEGKDAKSSSDFSITLTAPILSDTKRADFLTVDGLPGQWSVGLNFTQSLLNLNDNGATAPLKRRVSALLTKATKNCKTAAANQTLTQKARESKCEGLMTSEIDDYLSPAELSELDAIYNDTYNVILDRPYTVFGLTGTIGTQKFSYFNTATLAEQSQRKVSYTVGAWVGYLPHLKSPLFFVASFERKRDYTDAEAATYCPTGATTPTVKCTTGAFGPPTAEIDTKVTAKVRYRASADSRFGLELATSYDFHDKSWGIEVPVYLLVDKDNGLTGGLRGAYDSKADDFQFGAFVGTTFDFLKH